jgi:enoyl-CoA hydratase/carnithine racemase
VAVITLDNPPVNGLGHATRAGVVEGIGRANADPAIDIIVLTGAGKAFSGGADIREFNTPKSTAEPTLSAAIRTAEASGESGRRSDQRVCAWAEGWSWRSVATFASRARMRPSHCRR